MPLEHINEPLADTVNLSNDGFDGFGRRRLSQVEQAAKDLFTSDTDYLQPDFENRQEPAERHLIEVFESATADNEKECQERALEYLESLSPLTQLRLLHVFNQSGYVAHIDGAAYDERDKWIMALQFNSMAKGSSNALVALTSERWESRMRRKSEKLETAELLQYPSGRDLAYRSRIALPEEWVGYAELGYIAPGVIAAKGRQGVISRVAQIDHIPSRLSARDINILHAGYAVSWERKHDYVAYGGESDEISIIGKNLLTPHLEGDDLEFVKRTTSKSKIFKRIDRLTESNIELSPQKDDFIDILEVDGFDDDETRAIFQLAHQDGIRDALEGATGIDLASLTLSTQSRLLRYMTSRSKEEFSRLADAAERARLASGSTSEFYEAFLATEFGDDLGDILLDLTETADGIELRLAIESIATVRTSSQVIAEHFKSEESLDKLIAERIPTAFAKRVTEMLALARQDGIDAVIESLDAVAQASSELAESLKRGTFRQVDMTTNFGSFGAEEFPVTITARPNGENARLGFTVRGMGVTGKERLNIRLDYEEGRLSLDIGSGAKQGVNASDIARKVGADLARGELALSKFRGAQAALHGNHIREPFEDMPDLYSEEFAGVVNRFIYRLRLNDSTHSQIAA